MKGLYLKFLFENRFDNQITNERKIKVINKQVCKKKKSKNIFKIKAKIINIYRKHWVSFCKIKYPVYCIIIKIDIIMKKPILLFYKTKSSLIILHILFECDFEVNLNK